MSDRNKSIVKDYFSDIPTYKELGLRYGIGPERIRQILVKFFVKAHRIYIEEQGEP